VAKAVVDLDAKLLSDLGYKANWLCGGTNEWMDIK
jgi:hypothetical protein